MSVLVRFRIHEQSPSGPTYEQIAHALAQQGLMGPESREFLVWGNPSFPDSTVIEYLRGEHLATALDGVNRAIDAAGIRAYCTGGDLHLPAAAIT